MTNQAQEFLNALRRTLDGDPYPPQTAKRYSGIEYRITSRKDPLDGTFLEGKYRIVERIGSGSMSHVYKAVLEAIDRTVAIKILKKEWCTDPLTVKRFHQEAKAVSVLKHQNILTIYDVGNIDVIQPYFVMEFLNGCSLADEVTRQGALPEERALPIFIQVCLAMQHAHENGLIHRDLKPANIMLLNDSNHPDFVKLVDFGIVKLSKQSQILSQKLTQKGEIWGSPTYMSPEQCLGHALDCRSDIYSLGTVMYETLTGKVAFDGKNITEIISKQLSEMPPSISSLPLKYPVSSRLQNVIFRSLAKDVDKRQKNMIELRNELEQCLKLSITAKQTPPSFSPQKSFQPLKFFALSAMLIFVLVLTAFCFMFFNKTNPTPKTKIESTIPAVVKVKEPRNEPAPKQIVNNAQVKETHPIAKVKRVGRPRQKMQSPLQTAKTEDFAPAPKRRRSKDEMGLWLEMQNRESQGR